jgi:hypothetical protein
MVWFRFFFERFSVWCGSRVFWSSFQSLVLRVVLSVTTITITVSPCRYSFELNYTFVFKLSPCFICNMFFFGCFPSVWLLIADVSEPSISSIFLGSKIQYVSYCILLPKKMELIEGSETSAISNQTPGKHSKENILQINPYPANVEKRVSF